MTDTTGSPVPANPSCSDGTLPQKGPVLARGARRRAMASPAGAQVEMATLAPGRQLPLLVLSLDPTLELEHWAGQNEAVLSERLRQHGALLFRGFHVDGVEAFSRAAHVLCGGLFDDYGDLPRNTLGSSVYSSTHYPPEEPILWHNEGAHLANWPGRMCFYILQPAERGGGTTLVDCRRLWSRLDEAFRQDLLNRQITYVRHFHPHLDQPWQDVFRETDPAVVEARCTAAGMQCEWPGDHTLRTRYTVPAVQVHASTGETTFFNQLFLFHPACLPVEVRRSLASLYPEDEWPRNVTYGDGSAIPDEMMHHAMQMAQEETAAIPWQKGDVAVLDNELVSHGRETYDGTRRLVVAMGDMQSRIG